MLGKLHPAHAISLPLSSSDSLKRGSKSFYETINRAHLPFELAKVKHCRYDASNEYLCQVQLAEEGLGPKVCLKHGLIDNTYVIKFINFSANLQDYLNAIDSLGDYYAYELGKSVGLLLTQFWQNWTHNALNPSEIVVDYCDDTDDWYCYIIDMEYGQRSTDNKQEQEQFINLLNELGNEPFLKGFNSIY